MAGPFGDISGIWRCDDGATYFISEDLDNGTVTWVGLDPQPDALTPPIFFRGIYTANVFQGRWEADGVTVSGEWADVPRGRGEGYGLLAFQVSWSRESPGGGPVLLLQRVDERTTAGFQGSFWESTGLPVPPQDIVRAAGAVQRFDDHTLVENNIPCRDFTVMWCEVIDVEHPAWPPDPNDYCSFFDSNTANDHDFSFSFYPAWKGEEYPQGTDPQDFWSNGWLPPIPFINPDPARAIRELYASDPPLGGRFHAEAAMYGRTTDHDHCLDPFEVLLPGWNERGGNSVLVNGTPVEGNFCPGFAGADPTRQTITFPARHDGSEEIVLAAGTIVRVSGVVADDVGHHDLEGNVVPAPAEIHPIYSVDIPQDFDRPRRYPLYSGAWHGSDNGTYYLRQIGDTVWWLGLSRDQGRSYANVFKGAVKEGGIAGRWFDVDLTGGSILTHGELVIDGDGAGEASTTLTKYQDTPDAGSPAGFHAAWWNKLYDAHGIPAGNHGGPIITGNRP
jgi:hypothetical protein